MYQFVAKILPKKLVKRYKELLGYTNIKTEPNKFIGFVILFGVLMALAGATAISFILPLSTMYFFLVLVSVYVFFEVVVYLLLVLSTDSKAKFVEKVLPDALQIMSMNIKAGMTTDRALLLAARPEFGPLEKELNRAGKQILAGMEISQALLEIPKRIHSQLLERTIRLIVEGVSSGGELSDLLQQTAEDIQNSNVVKGEVQSNVLMYAIFIFFAAGIGAPLLYGISTYLVGILSVQFSQFQVSETVTTGMMRGEINISQEFLLLFPVISLIVTSIFGSLIIGIIKEGDEKGGIKIIPLLLVVSLAVFFFVRVIVSGIFAGV